MAYHTPPTPPLHSRVLTFPPHPVQPRPRQVHSDRGRPDHASDEREAKFGDVAGHIPLRAPQRGRVWRRTLATPRHYRAGALVVKGEKKKCATFKGGGGYCGSTDGGKRVLQSADEGTGSAMRAGSCPVCVCCSRPACSTGISFPDSLAPWLPGLFSFVSESFCFFDDISFV